MTARHYLLGGSALLVLALVVVLFREVRSSPVEPPAPAKAQRDVPEVKDKDDDAKPVVATVAENAKPSGISRLIKRPSVDAADAEPVRDKDTPQTANSVKLDDVMAEANKAYDRQDFDEARGFAQKVLKDQPNNSRMLRIMVSAACIENDAPEAQKHYNLLNKADREQMKTRCTRYGVTFVDPPPPK